MLTNLLLNYERLSNTFLEQSKNLSYKNVSFTNYKQLFQGHTERKRLSSNLHAILPIQNFRFSYCKM